MPAPARILAATDFSAIAGLAVDRAAQLAVALPASLALLHVVEPDLLLAMRDLVGGRDLAAAVVEQARMQLSATARAVQQRHGLAPSTELREGMLLHELRDGTTDADLVVLGARGAHPLRELTLGTSADRMARVSRSPLLVVRTPALQPYRQVLVAVDFSDQSRHALEVALRLLPQARIELFHCFDVAYESRMRLGGADDAQIDGYRERTQGSARAQIDAWAGTLPQSGRLYTVLRNGDVRFELMKHLEHHPADLVVLGKQGRSVLADTLLGSATTWMLNHLACDVLVVPPGVRSAS